MKLFGLASGYPTVSPYLYRSYNARDTHNTTVLGGERLLGNAGNSPAELSYFSIICSAIGGSDPGVLSFSVLIEYDVTFSEPNYEDRS